MVTQAIYSDDFSEGPSPMGLSDGGIFSQVGDSEAPAPGPLGSEDFSSENSATPSPMMSADLDEAVETAPSPASNMGEMGEISDVAGALPRPAEIASQAMDAGQGDLPVPREPVPGEDAGGNDLTASRAAQDTAPRPRDDLAGVVGQAAVVTGTPVPMSIEDLGLLDQ